MAARNNPLTNWLNLSFDSFNLLHRWTGRIVVLEAVTHAAAWAAATAQAKGAAAVWSSIMGSQMELFGFVVSRAPRDIKSLTIF